MEFIVNSTTGIDLSCYQVESIQELKQKHPQTYHKLYKTKLTHTAIFIVYKFPLKKKAVSVHNTYNTTLSDIGYIIVREMKNFFEQRNLAIKKGGDSYLSLNSTDITYYYQFTDLNIKFKENKKTNDSELYLDIIVTT